MTGKLGQGEVKVKVTDQGIELAVTDDVVEVIAEGLSRLPLNGVGLTDEVFQTVISRQPLHRCLRANTGNPEQMVGTLPHQSCQLRVPCRRHQVFLLNGLRRHASKV